MPRVLESEHYLIVHKPSGIATHSPGAGQLGFVEWCEKKFSCSLKVVHRLDKETSGVLCFAKSKEAAQVLTELFSQRCVSKSYVLVTDKKAEWDRFSVFDQGKGLRVSQSPMGELQSYESFTDFEFIEENNSNYVYRAKPLTGKTHQIRKHATEAGISILGDDLYGGSAYPRLMLHAESLEFDLDGDNVRAEIPPGRLFQSCQSDHQLNAWIAAFERREVLWPEKLDGVQAFRLFHTEANPLRGDQVGAKTLLGWWSQEPPSQEDQNGSRGLCGFSKKTIGCFSGGQALSLQTPLRCFSPEQDLIIAHGSSKKEKLDTKPIWTVAKM